MKIKEKETYYYNDPTIIFKKLCFLKPYTLLLESAEVKKKFNLESMMIINSAIRITANKNIVYIISLTKNGNNIIKLLKKKIKKKFKKKTKNIYLLNGIKIIFPIIFYLKYNEDEKLKLISVLDILRLLIKLTKKNKIPFFFGGLFSYNLISNFEFLKKFKPFFLKKQCPDFCFYLSENLLIFNHKKKKCILQTSYFSKNKKEKKRLNLKKKKIIYNLKKIIKKKKKYKKNKNKYNKKIKINIKKKYICKKNSKKFTKMILKVKKKIKKGEIFQIVISRIFKLKCIFSLYAYQYLKNNNPSPYMFFMQDIKFSLFGASPESSLKYNIKNRNIEIHPIAGTRPRGKNKNGKINKDLDNRIELEMRTNKKELSEHIMLVDLARNDLAKICIPGTRYVSYLTKVDKYSHVMHLVSKVVGKLCYHLDIFHAYFACMNMGTLSGAPKIRAMQIISKIEKNTRYSYGGSIGYFNSFGNLDMCIIIRSAYIEKYTAYIQAGAGIVLDSIPKEEVKESKNKAKAVIQSIIQSNLIKR